MEVKKFSKDFFKLSLGTLGIVYGDIGTSPLYTLQECFNPSHGLELSLQNIFGILSLIFWAMMLVVVMKYIIFILKADNHGEGGIISLLSLIVPKVKREKLLTIIIWVGLIGTALLLSDGMITPAISVLGAVEGIKTATPMLTPLVVPISVVILIGLFLVQKKGTEKIGNIFGPLMIIWFGVIGILGFLSIVKAPRILNAIKPYYAINFFYKNGFWGFLILGSVVLAITGTEALYADMGHFGKEPIKVTFFFLVMPSLLLNYFGQGAAILLNGAAAIDNPFYYICPAKFIYPLIIIATIAAVIASQALISGAFSLVQQTMHLGFIPKIRIFHTSEDVKGQIYIPFVNYFLMAACIGLVITFKSSGNLASAYGMSVIGTMLCTSILFYILTVKVWNWNKRKAIPLFLLFIIIDLAFFGANLNKIATGGWFPLLTAVLLFSLMIIWKKGSGLVYKFISSSNISLEILLKDLETGNYNITRVPGTAVFMVGSTKSLGVLLHHIKHNKALHKTVYLLSVTAENTPFINKEEKLRIVEHREGFYELSASYGYMEQPNINEIFDLCRSKGYQLNAGQTSFYLGRVNIDVSGQSNLVIWQKKIFAFMHKNAEPAVDYFGLPPGRVIELGSKITI